MTPFDRRKFVATVAGAVPAASLAGNIRTQPLTSIFDRGLLLALGEVVLPSELGSHGVERVVTAFDRWLQAYRPGAERDHGYGTGKIEHLPEDPTEQWTAQLTALEEAARRQEMKAFTDTSLVARQRLVTEEIENLVSDERLPHPTAAPHVALGLLAYFYSTPEAADLCYRAVIGKETCRSLDQAPSKPKPLGGGGGR